MTTQPTPHLSNLLAELGKATIDRKNAYERYDELKSIEDHIRHKLEATLHDMGLKSAKGDDYTASIAEKPTVVIKNEKAIVEWLRDEPDIETDQYIGLKTTEFKSLAQTILKDTGEVVPGTEVEVRESLAIRANKKGK